MVIPKPRKKKPAAESVYYDMNGRAKWRVHPITPVATTASVMNLQREQEKIIRLQTERAKKNEEAALKQAEYEAKKAILVERDRWLNCLRP